MNTLLEGWMVVDILSLSWIEQERLLFEVIGIKVVELLACWRKIV